MENPSWPQPMKYPLADGKGVRGIDSVGTFSLLSTPLALCLLPAISMAVILVTFLSNSPLASQTWSSDSLGKNLALVWLRT